MPEGLNPASGFIVAANNPIAFAHHPLLFEPATGYRARRILDVVGANLSISVEDCIRLQNDVESLPGRRLRDLALERLGDAGGQEAGNAEVALGLLVLREWDGRLTADSSGGCVYEGLLQRLVEKMIGSRLSPALRDQVLGRSVHTFFPTGPFSGRLTPAVIEAVAEGRPAPGEAVDRESCDRLLAASLAETVADLRRRRGSDPSRWKWGAEHQGLYEHPIAKALAVLGPILNRGPFAGSGDTDTVRLMGHGEGEGVVSPSTAAICRAVYDLGEWGRSVISHSPGQSGHPASPNYADMIDDYLAGRPHAIEFGPGGAERQPAAERQPGDERLLRLLPRDGKA